MSKTLSEIVDEAEAKVKREIDAVRSQHISEMRKMKNEFKILQSEVNNKTIQVEIREKEISLLKEEIERMKEGKTSSYINESQASKIILLEKNLEINFQKLVSSSRRSFLKKYV